jgi:uncharacterized membrane protein YkvA (DUF1232 family)
MKKNEKPRGVGEDFVKKGASRIKEEDVKKVLDRAEEIGNKFESSGPLKRLVKDFKLLMSLLNDYWHGTYREIPWWAISAVVFALLYVLSPIDLIPDVIPVIGYTDDAAVVALTLLLIEQELEKYKEWKLQNA